MVSFTFVKLTEMYDLSTAKGKMGMIAIRTPSLAYINKKYSGLVRNYTFVRAVSCNVKIACASMLPADPLQIGTEAGKVAPQDLFNPLLYKTVSNESWNGLVNRIYALSGFTSLSGAVVGSRSGDAFQASSESNSTNAYYALLAEGGFKKAHPQQGLTMTSVKPYVWSLLHTVGAPYAGVQQISAPDSTTVGVSYGGTDLQTVSGNASYMRGHPQPMPRIPTYFAVTESGNTDTPALSYMPPVYCAVIITPPTAQTLLYYRLVVEWYIEFTGLRSDVDFSLIGATAVLGQNSHYENYYTESSKLADVSQDAVDSGDGRSVEADGVSLDLVMES